jgi:SAM-dependent methyltransferase
MTGERPESYDSAAFFDKNSALYADSGYTSNREPPAWDVDFIEFMRKNSSGRTLLDVGAGSGLFSSLVKVNIPEMQVTALDPSVNLLNLIGDQSIRKVVGKMPELNLDPQERFSFIHVSNVLHHLVGKTINESRNLLKESLLELRAHLDDSGFLMILEETWETYIVPTASRTLAFLLLSTANKLDLTVPRFFSHYHEEGFKGLIVCMYTASELENMLKNCGFTVAESKAHYYPFYGAKRLSARENRFKRVTLLKRWAQTEFLCEKSRAD